jgi:hypothetical protein
VPIPRHLSPTIAERKLTHYLLNLDHPEGGPKANYLIQRGFAAEGPETLRGAIEAAARSQTTIKVERNRHGAKYVLQCEIETPSGARPCVQTVWIDQGDGQARFVTLVPRVDVRPRGRPEA